MQQLFTNTEQKAQDKLSSFINREAMKSDTVRIATAYFTHDGLTKSFFDKAEVRLLVGMSGVINIKNLREVLHKDNVTVKYYYDKFHPKIYLFSTGVAVVGSSNYTKPGIGIIENANRECNIATDDTALYQEIGDYFDELWASAAVLRESQLDQLEHIQQIIEQQDTQTAELMDKFRPILDYEPYKRDETAKIFAMYDSFCHDFAELSEQYFASLGHVSDLPDRLEIDQFLSWLYENYREDPAGEITNKALRAATIEKYLHMFANDPRHTKYFDQVKSKAIYTENMLTTEKVHNLDEQSVRIIARGINSFDDRLIDTFIRENGIENIRQCFAYLLFGDEDIKIRLSEVLRGQYKLKYFQTSRALELLGWADNAYPIWNWRVALSMAILGFNNFHRDKTQGLHDRETNKLAK